MKMYTKQFAWNQDIQAVREGRAHVQRVLGGSVLGVWGAEARDAGQYICVAENAAGAASRRYNVRVKGTIVHIWSFVVNKIF